MPSWRTPIVKLADEAIEHLRIDLDDDSLQGDLARIRARRWMRRREPNCPAEALTEAWEGVPSA